MGRKLQKTNRHKKIKSVDPFYNGERKLLLDKYVAKNTIFIIFNQLNNFEYLKRGLISANKDPILKDDNQICSKLREVTRYNQALELKKKKTAEKKDATEISLHLMPDDKGAEVPLRLVSNMTKNADESDTSYLNRIDRVCQICRSLFFKCMF